MKNIINIAYVPGDGIGPELIKIAVDTIDLLFQDLKESKVNFTLCDIGYDIWAKTEEFICEYGRKFGGISEKKINNILNTDAMIYVATSGGNFPTEFTTPFPVLRRRFNVFANVRPAFSYPNTPFLKKDIDFVLVREQTEGMWMGEEKVLDSNVIKATATISRDASMKVAKFAFEMARKRNKLKKVTCIHKENVLKYAFGEFVKSCELVAKEYEDIALEKMHTDVLPFELIRDPHHFDVIVTTNMYGDIISGETAAITGGLGVSPSGEYGDNYAIFRPVHGSAPDIAGKNIANPIATFLSVVMMLEWLGDRKEMELLHTFSMILKKSVIETLKEGKSLPQDIGGDATTEDFKVEVWKKIKDYKGGFVNG